MREDLLRPSLSAAPPAVGLYSVSWSLLPCFFLGPYPVILYSALNSWRLKRPWDAIMYLLAIAGVFGVMFVTNVDPLPDAVQRFKELSGTGNVSFTMLRVYAVLLWGGFYFMHRAQHRSSNMLLQAPSAWKACLVACLLSVPLIYTTARGAAHLLVHLGLV
jgi:hypothetical protein